MYTLFEVHTNFICYPNILIPIRENERMIACEGMCEVQKQYIMQSFRKSSKRFEETMSVYHAL